MTATVHPRKIVHPLYREFEDTWRALYDIHEGRGGFLHPDRPYLFAHPREWLDHSLRGAGVAMVPNPNPSQPSPKLKMRRKMARYENLAESILNQVAGALFQTVPTRTFGGNQSAFVTTWWANADGKGTHIDRLLQQAWTMAGTFGHSVVMLHRNDANNMADLRVRARLYTPLDMLDWIEDDDGRLTSVKLLEAAPRRDLSVPYSVDDVRVRVVTDTSWTLYDKAGDIYDQGDHGFGTLPVALLYGKRRSLTPVIGRSVIGDPMLHIDAYNLVSEIRELLRSQTFGVLNVPVGTGADANAQREMEMIGQQMGTSNVMFSSQPAQYISPSSDNAAIYHEHMDRLTRMIYRLASAAWEGDSRDAESGDSRRLKHSEQEQVLAKYAGELQATDLALLELVYRLSEGKNWESAWERDKPSVAYTTSFSPPDIATLTEGVTNALLVELGPTATHELKKRLARVTLSDLDEAVLRTIDREIDAQPVLDTEQRHESRMASVSRRFAAATEEAA